MAAELIPFVFVLASVGLYVSLQLVSDNWHCPFNREGMSGYMTFWNMSDAQYPVTVKSIGLTYA